MIYPVPFLAFTPPGTIFFSDLGLPLLCSPLTFHVPMTWTLSPLWCSYFKVLWTPRFFHRVVLTAYFTSVFTQFEFYTRSLKNIFNSLAIHSLFQPSWLSPKPGWDLSAFSLATDWWPRAQVCSQNCPQSPASSHSPRPLFSALFPPPLPPALIGSRQRILLEPPRAVYKSCHLFCHRDQVSSSCQAHSVHALGSRTLFPLFLHILYVSPLHC